MFDLAQRSRPAYTFTAISQVGTFHTPSVPRDVPNLKLRAKQTQHNLEYLGLSSIRFFLNFDDLEM